MKYLFVVLVLVLSACETMDPYYKLGLGQRYASGTQHTLVGAPQDQSRHFQEIEGSCTTAYLAGGVEFEHGLIVEVDHESCLNESPEISMYGIKFIKHGYFGGK